MKRKYKVKVKIIKLGFIRDDEEHEDDDVQKAMAIEVKWEGERVSGFAPFNLVRKKMRKDSTKEVLLKKKRTGESAIHNVGWNEEEFENVCIFGSDSWEICFSVLYGKEKQRRRRRKMAVIGRSRLDLSEIVGRKKKKDDVDEFEEKVLMNLKFGGMYTQANLLVRFDFVEILDGTKSVEPRSKPNRSTQSECKAKSRSSETQFEPVKKIMGLFSWKKRRLSFSAMTETECTTGSSFSVDPTISGSPQVEEEEEEDKGEWEPKELRSRDGKTTLKTSVFFASFDQCSNKASGQSACTAIVAVISHWLQTNPNSIPTKPEFNLLIQQGSSEWRNLCENDAFSRNFPNRHFDLETILHSGVRPVAISPSDSFVGFFSPDKFASLKGAMSFDEIWDCIEKDHLQPRIYIVSWNDHFFVLKVEENSCYIIDTLGERLYEGCDQAFMLRFDDSSTMYGTEEMENMFRGKECCKEFIRRFLAAIPVMELEEEERKGAVSYYSLHNQLQIEFNSTHLLSSSAKSSPFSSSSSDSSASPSSSSMDDDG